MPQYRLVFSNGKRSVRHVDVEASDLVTATRAFTPPVGWRLTAVRQTFGVAAGPQVPHFASGGSGIGMAMLVFGFAIMTLIRQGAPASMTYSWALAAVAGIVGIPLLWMNHKATQRYLASTRQASEPAKWPEQTTWRLGWCQSLGIVLHVVVGVWALTFALDPITASGVIAGLCMGSAALSGVIRLGEGSSGVKTEGAKPITV